MPHHTEERLLKLRVQRLTLPEMAELRLYDVRGRLGQRLALVSIYLCRRCSAGNRSQSSAQARPAGDSAMESWFVSTRPSRDSRPPRSMSLVSGIAVRAWSRARADHFRPVRRP